MARVSVIGIGNTLMGDDGVGVRIAEETSGLLAGMTGVEVVTGHTAGMALMPAVLRADSVIFIDAVACGGEPGSVYRFDPDVAEVTKTRSETSHGIGIPHLITASRLHGHFPQFIIYAVHIGDTMCGPDTLTEAVALKVPKVAGMIARDVTGMQQQVAADAAHHS